MTRTTFPDGEWVELREASEVPERLRRPYLAAGIAGSDATAADRVSLVRRAQALGAVAIISAWSYPQPVSVDALEDLPSLRYDEILQLVSPRVDLLAWSMVATPETMADPKATGGESNSSVPGSQIPMPPPTVESLGSTPST